ncbi:MAG: YwaF family protein [Candidatus Marinimicrobia bacterium]|nr:YwaF family protein [Candidatus Neomarinimicrobiota bacterium]
MMMIINPYFISLSFSLIILWLVWTGQSISKYAIIIATVFAVVTTTYYNITHNPGLMLWLCNFTILMGLFLCFRFRQVLFDIFFYFCWTGSLLTLFIFDNPVAPPMDSNPISFVGFILKHSIPLILTVQFIKNDNRGLSLKSLKNSLIALIVYAVFMAIFNIIFDQNILDFRYATLDIEKAFGPWPYYVIVNIAIALIWFKSIEIISKIFGLIRT